MFIELTGSRQAYFLLKNLSKSEKMNQKVCYFFNATFQQVYSQSLILAQNQSKNSGLGCM